MKLTFFKSILLLSASSLILYSCNKDKPEPAPEPDTDTQSTIDNSMAEAEFCHIYTEINNIGINEQGVQKTTGDTCYYNIGFLGCINVSVTPCWTDTATWPKTVVIDFGNGCLCRDGRYRKGKLIATFHDKWKNENAKVEVVLQQDYQVYHFIYGGYLQHTGMVTITNQTPGGIDTTDINSKPRVNILVNSNGNTGTYATIITPSGTIKWQSNRIYEQIDGHMSASDPTDDVFTLYGNADGVNLNGVSFTVVVPQTDPLRKAISCTWVEDGTLSLTPENLQTRTVNYGYPDNGNCDSLATLTIGNGSPIEFTLP